MANYYSKCRSNYFKVTDTDKFKMDMKEMSVELMENEPGNFALFAEDGWPSVRFVSAGEGQEEDIDFVAELSKHLVDGEVAVLMESGSEGRRYVIGTAIAVNSKNETCSISIDHIYEMANVLGPNITRAEY